MSDRPWPDPVVVQDQYGDKLSVEFEGAQIGIGGTHARDQWWVLGPAEARAVANALLEFAARAAERS